MLETFHKSYSSTPEGMLLLADGINAVRRWDGLTATTDTAGVIAPTNALTLRSSGKGPISGTYFAYSRFLDNRSNQSDLSPISSAFRTYTTGRILTATNTAPIALGVFAHGLEDGDVVAVTGVQGNTGANGLWYITVHDENNISLRGSIGNGAHTANTGTWVGGRTAPPRRGLVEAASNASPIVVTATGHGLTTGDTVTIKGATGNTAANGKWVITVLNPNSFSLNSSTGNGAHTANTGFWIATTVYPNSGTIIQATNTSPISIGSVEHRLNTGESVVITGVEGNTAANGTFTVTVVDANNFELQGSTGNGGYAGGGVYVGGTAEPFFSGPITGATNASPIVITSGGNGLMPGHAVTITGVQGTPNAPDTWTINRVDADTFELRDSTGNASYTANTGTWTCGARAILYTSVPVSTETKVTRRQIIRNTNGQTDTFYVDVDTTDISDTSLEGTFDDATLVDQTEVPILDTDGSALANLYAPPPNYKAVLAHHLGRMFYAAEVVVKQGHAQVTNGSATVTGIGTNWKTTLANRTFYVVGHTSSYTISSVNEANQTLTLSATYTGANDKFAVYAIRPSRTERRVIYYSEANLPEAVPVTNQIILGETDDEIVGIFQAGSFLYFVERHNIWRFSMQTDPAVDGFPWPIARRGCVNNRSYAIVGERVYLLDTDGIYAFTGSGNVDPSSLLIQDIFRPSDFEFQLNLQAADYFHASHYQNQETIRWFVAFTGQSLPRHAIVYNYRMERWWIEEYSRPITCSASGDLNGRRIIYVGSDAKTTLALWHGNTDGPDPLRGTVHGAVTSATLTSLTDTTASFPPAGLVGNPVSIVDGRGRGQTRRVSSVSGTTINISQPWLILPDTTSVYQLGGINWRYRTGLFRYTESEQNSPTRVELIFQPQTDGSICDIEVFQDHSDDPLVWVGDQSFDNGAGVRVTDDEQKLSVDLDKQDGFVQHRFDRHRDMYIDGPRYVSVQLSGISGEDRTTIYQVTIDGATDGRSN